MRSQFASIRLSPAFACACLLCLAMSCGDDDGAPPPGGDSGSDTASDSDPIDVDTGSRPTPIGCADCTSFVGGRVFDGTTTREAAVVIEGDTIREVVEGAVEVTAGATVDLTSRTLLPGLLDLHVHQYADAGPYSYFSREDHQLDHFKSFLRAGVTTVLDVGSPQSAIFELRRRIRDGEILGPTLLAAGPMVTATGGHPCRNGSPPGETCILIDEEDDVDQLMTQLLPDQPDVIKVILEAGTEMFPLPRLPFDLLPNIVSAAEARSVPVVAHTSRSEDVSRALDAGIRFFVHMPFVDAMTPELCARAARENAVIVPTLVVMDNLIRWSEGRLTQLEDPSYADDVPQETLDSLANARLRPAVPYGPEFQNAFATASGSVRTCIEAGVTIAAGTDAGNPGTVHGRALHWELAHFVESAGMTPAQALASATRVAADALGLTDRGRIEAGARADVLIVEGDPSEDIHDIERVVSVILAGETLDRDALALPRNTSIERMPIAPREEGSVCVEGETCEEGTSCASYPLARCTMECVDGSCPVGAVCRDLGEGSLCYTSSGCDPIAQDCLNGASCQWLGSGVTLCLFAGPARAGDSCGFGGSFCAAGTQCAGTTCRKLCLPGDATTCPEGEACEDQSEQAGLPIGFCMPR